jgi:uncharacterized protein (DUF58 family)
MRSALGCAALGVLLLLVAGTFDAEPFYVTGSALVLLGLGAIAWIRIGALGATVHRTLGARSVIEEEPLTVRIEALAGRLPLPPGFVDEPLLARPVPLSAGRRRSQLRIEATFGRRGRRILQPPSIVLRDPLGLVEKRITAPAPDELLVLPRIHPVRATAAGGESTGAHARTLLTAAAETEIDGLRQHVEGSPASRIHWPSVAKPGPMMERKLVAEADARPLVILDPRGAATQDALDSAVRAAGSLVLHFAKRSGCGLLLPGDRRAVHIDPDLAGWPPAHVRLALLGDEMGPALTAAQNRRGLVVFVSARVVDRPPRGMGRTPGGQLLVIPGEIASRRPVLEVAGCRGYLAARSGSGAALEAVGAV